MRDREVNKLMERLLTEPLHDYIHQQTVKIPEKSHQKLIALAKFSQQTKSELASALLTAAIDDAIQALPADEIIGMDNPGVRSFIVKDAILAIAHQGYADFLEKQGRPWIGGGNIQLVDVDGDPVRLEITEENREWTKKRLLVYIPEINNRTFLLFFNKGKSGKSYSLREYREPGNVILTYADNYPYTADEILKMAKYKIDAPTHPAGDEGFWLQRIAEVNQRYLMSDEATS